MIQKRDNFNLRVMDANVWQKGGFTRANLTIRNGVVTSIDNDSHRDSDLDRVDANGMTILPGLVDLHVHFREPGFSYKETIKTGSLAAARGGFTTVCTMPNLSPAPDSLSTLQEQTSLIRRDSAINIIPFATITRERRGRECVDFKALAPYVAGFSDDGSGVQDENVMREAMMEVAQTGSLIAAHCEVNSLLNGGYIHDGEYARDNSHKGICSESEWKEVERDIRLAEETGCRLHVCHISTKESVSLIRDAKRRGVKVTCETGPHYLAFSDSDLKDEGRFKMNPPIRSASDRYALIEGLADGTIDAIATDHAPHSADEKSRGLKGSAMGVVGLETSLAAVYTYLVENGFIPIERLVEAMSLRPSEILGIEAGIREGEKANLTLVDLNRSFVVNPADFLSMGKATPFEGTRLKGVVMLTLCDGNAVWSDEALHIEQQ